MSKDAKKNPEMHPVLPSERTGPPFKVQTMPGRSNSPAGAPAKTKVAWNPVEAA